MLWPYLLWTILLTSSPVLAAPELSSFASMEEGILDDMDAFAEWSETAYMEIRNKPIDALWVHAVFAFALGIETRGEGYQIPPTFAVDLDKARVYAEQHGLWEALARLQLISEGKRETSLESLQKGLAMAREHKLTILEARMAADLSLLARRESQIQLAADSIERALEILNSVQNVPDLDRMMIKHRVAGYFGQHGTEQQTLDLYREVESISRHLKVRQFRSDVNWNLARKLAQSSKVENLDEAMKHYQTAMQIDKELGHEASIGISYLGLAEVKSKLNRTPEALEDALKARSILQKSRSTIWEGEDLKLIAQLHVRLGHWTEAETALAEAEALLPKDGKQDHFTISVERARALAGRRLYPQAYDNAVKALNLIQAIHAEEFEKRRAESNTRMEVQVATEKSRSLQKQIEFDQKIRHGLFIVVGLCVGIMVLTFNASRQSRKIHLAHRKMQSILQNINQGIFTLNARLEIDPQDTWHLQKILGEHYDEGAPNGLSAVFGRSSLSADQRSIIRNVLDSVFYEEALVWSLNAGNLPYEISYGEENQRVFNVSWQAIVDREGRIARVLVVLMDVTEQKALEHQVLRERVQNQELFAIFSELQRVDRPVLVKLLTQIEGAMTDLDRPTLHACKGVARTLRLDVLSNAIHSWETRLENAEADENAIKASMRSTLDLYRHALQGVVSDSPDSTDTSLFAALHDQLAEILRRAEQENLAIKGISLKDEILDWPESYQQLFRETLPLIVSNIIDHGFVFPRQRDCMLHPLELQLAAFEKEGGIHFEIRDNGAGIDFVRLRAKAGSEDGQLLSEQQLVELLFHKGGSTAECLTTTSGRGMGLTAIRLACEKLGGRVTLRPNPEGQGSCVTFALPKPTHTHSRTA